MAEDLRQFIKITGVHHVPGRKSVTQIRGLSAGRSLGHSKDHHE